MLPCIIDMEASGFGKGSYPIEVGVCLSDTTTHCYLIRPEQSWVHWDKEAEKIHGINRDILFEKGLSVNDVCIKLNDLLKDEVVYSDAWSFDNTWLWKIYEEAEAHPNFKLETFRKLLTEEDISFWQETKREVIADLNLIRHRASADARILQEIYRRIKA